MSMTTVAADYIRANISVIPVATDGSKKPAITEWKHLQTSIMPASEFKGGGIGVICGNVSGGLEIIDFDEEGIFFDRWARKFAEKYPDLLSTLLIETSPSGGKHVAYRCLNLKTKSDKLAYYHHVTDLASYFVNDIPYAQRGTKNHQLKKRSDGRYECFIAAIETKGEGGYCVCAPTKGYELVQGSWTNIPTISVEERNAMIEASTFFDQGKPKKKEKPKEKRLQTFQASSNSIADEYRQRGDIRELLKSKGWTLHHETNAGEQWSRPGVTDHSSATLFPDGGFHVFTGNAGPLEEKATYSPFDLYAHFECNGDRSLAAKKLAQFGYGSSSKTSTIVHEEPPEETSGNLRAEFFEDVTSFLSVRDLMKYDVENDQNTLLGKRWLCKGGALLLVGQAGLGKSTLISQMSMTWALGLPFFGVLPKKPMKSLIIQAENDTGDLAEMIQGSMKGLDLTHEQREMVADNLNVFQEMTTTAEQFCRYLDFMLTRFEPDILWVDPLLAFLGGDVSDQKAVSKFLRNGLNPLLIKHGCALIMVHHTTKPATDPIARKNWTRADFSYIGAGSAELANWCRAGAVLRKIDETRFCLMFTKRCNRINLKDEKGAPVSDLWMKYSDDKLHWLEADAPEAEDKAADEAEMLADELFYEMEEDKVYFREEVVGLLMKLTKKSRTSMHRGKYLSAIHTVLERTKTHVVGSFCRKMNPKIPKGNLSELI